MNTPRTGVQLDAGQSIRVTFGLGEENDCPPGFQVTSVEFSGNQRVVVYEALVDVDCEFQDFWLDRSKKRQEAADRQAFNAYRDDLQAYYAYRAKLSERYQDRRPKHQLTVPSPTHKVRRNVS